LFGNRYLEQILIFFHC